MNTRGESLGSGWSQPQKRAGISFSDAIREDNLAISWEPQNQKHHSQAGGQHHEVTGGTLHGEKQNRIW